MAVKQQSFFGRGMAGQGLRASSFESQSQIDRTTETGDNWEIDFSLKGAQSMATVEKPDELKIFRDAAKSASEGSRVFIEINGCRVAIVPPEDAEYMDALEDAQDIRDAEKAME